MTQPRSSGTISSEIQMEPGFRLRQIVDSYWFDYDHPVYGWVVIGHYDADTRVLRYTTVEFSHVTEDVGDVSLQEAARMLPELYRALVVKTRIMKGVPS